VLFLFASYYKSFIYSNKQSAFGVRGYMQIVLASIRKVGLVLLLLLSLSELAEGQGTSDKFCRTIEKSVVANLSLTKVDASGSLTDSCEFRFSTGGADVSLSISRYRTAEEGHKSIDRFFDLVAELGQGLESQKDLGLVKLETDGSWDEGYFLKATTTNSGIVSLRRGAITVMILSLKDERLMQIEQRLRNLPEVKSQ
jgi:hypothetical protein